MSWAIIIESALGILAASGITGMIVLSNRFAKFQGELTAKIDSLTLRITTYEQTSREEMTAKISSLEKRCDNCERRFNTSIEKLSDSVEKHHTDGPHLSDDLKEMFKDNFASLNQRLDNIEKSLLHVEKRNSA